MGSADSIKFECKYCHSKISIYTSHAGKKGRCPKCKNIIIVPRPKIKLPEDLTTTEIASDVPKEYKLKDEKTSYSETAEQINKQKLYAESELEESELPGQYKLSWYKKLKLITFLLPIIGAIFSAVLVFHQVDIVPVIIILYIANIPVYIAIWKIFFGWQWNFWDCLLEDSGFMWQHFTVDSYEPEGKIVLVLFILICLGIGFGEYCLFFWFWFIK